VQKYEQIHQGRKQIIINNFLGGIAWAFGITIGFSLLIAILTLISKEINVIPVIGTFVSNIIDFVLSYNKHLHP
jgi:hypothetical protein